LIAELIPILDDLIAELPIHADASEIRRASAWMERICLERGIPSGAIGRLDVCVNEALANILAHGGATARSTPVLLRLAIHDVAPAREVVITVSDAGAPFNPLSVSATERPRILAEAEPGGLGLTMIRGAADSLSYRYHEGRNQLSVGVRWSDD
jgi:serine/threonine-protein kinase RsbW